MKSTHDIMKKVIRDQRLKREEQVGRPRAKSWSGKRDPRQERRDSKREVRQF